jgi:hypothetical protein
MSGLTLSLGIRASQSPLPHGHAGLTPQKSRQPKRQVSSREGVSLAPAQGKGSQPQRHVALGSDPAQGQTAQAPSLDTWRSV